MVSIENKISDLIKNALKLLQIDVEIISLEHPTELSHGDFSSNIALTLAKAKNQNPKELAQLILEKIVEDSDIEKIEVAGPGFINFYLSKDFYRKSIDEILIKGNDWGKNNSGIGKKVMVEYTDPNPFKAFHIGHLMSNTIGESISRLIEFSGATVARANYQGDVGPHVAKTIWGLKNGNGGVQDTASLGVAYAAGAKAYEENQENKEEINAINKAIYDGSDKEVSHLYEEGREVSLAHFEKIYKLLGTKFDYYFFESDTWHEGIEIVKKHIGNPFQESEGAVIFKGEDFDKTLHTRVFINSEGLPTYEAKELGLAYKKKEVGDFDSLVTITAVEQKEYFRVVLKALEQIDKDLADKVTHLTHGFMKLSTGKMSSRTGDVVSAERLIENVKKAVLALESERNIENKKETAEIIATAALKYMILRQAATKDIVYDLERSVSFEGDSGPYLQYANTRAKAVLEKVAEVEEAGENKSETTTLEKLLYRFPKVVLNAKELHEPHHVTTYLTELAGAFNSFYASEKIIGGENETYNLALSKAFQTTMQNGLYLLGIKTPDRM